MNPHTHIHTNTHTHRHRPTHTLCRLTHTPTHIPPHSHTHTDCHTHTHTHTHNYNTQAPTQAQAQAQAQATISKSFKFVWGPIICLQLPAADLNGLEPLIQRCNDASTLSWKQRSHWQDNINWSHTSNNETGLCSGNTDNLHNHPEINSHVT